MFYYLLAGATPADREELHLMKPQDYFYLNQVMLVNLLINNYLLLTSVDLTIILLPELRASSHAQHFLLDVNTFKIVVAENSNSRND